MRAARSSPERAAAFWRAAAIRLLRKVLLAANREQGLAA